VNDVDLNPVARLLGRSAAILMVLGLLTGGLVSSAMTGMIRASVQSAVAAHLNAILGAFFILGVAWSLPLLGYGPAGQRRLAWLVIVPNYANWAVTSVKSFLFVAGVGWDKQPANNAVFIALTFTVVIPSLIAAVAWAAGFRKGISGN